MDGEGFLQLEVIKVIKVNFKVIKKQTHRAQSGRNSSAAPLRFVARVKGWWEDERAGDMH